MVPHKTDLVNLTPQTMPNKVRPEPNEWPIAVLGYACYTNAYASVAQLDRASVFGTEGWGFESLRAYWFLQKYRRFSPFVSAGHKWIRKRPTNDCDPHSGWVRKRPIFGVRRAVAGIGGTPILAY